MMSRTPFTHIACYQVHAFLLLVASLHSFSPPLAEGRSIRDTDEGPLYLTPFIESGRLHEGRRLAKVTGLGWNITSYSGLLTVDKKHGSNMFFWYFPAEREPSEVPLVFWQNGLSTASSYGVFLQNGPFDLLESSTLKPRNTSWQKYYHVVYIDNPVGVGYSTTKSESGYTTTLSRLIDNLHNAVHQFLSLFPDLGSREIYITGVSLAGKYVMPLAKRLRQDRVNVKGIFVGDPLLDPGIQVHYGLYLLELGFVDRKQKAYLDAKEKQLLDLFYKKDYKKYYDDIYTYLLNDNGTILSESGLNSIYDYNEPYIDPTYYQAYMSKPNVRKALHVGSIQFDDGTKVTKLGADIFARPVTGILEELVEDMDILIYAGQMDVVCAYPMLMDTLESLNWTGRSDYRNADRTKLYAGDSDYVWGYSRTYRTLTDVLVRKASHSAVTSQPSHVLHMLFNFTRYQRFQ